MTTNATLAEFHVGTFGPLLVRVTELARRNILGCTDELLVGWYKRLAPDLGRIHKASQASGMTVGKLNEDGYRAVKLALMKFKVKESEALTLYLLVRDADKLREHKWTGQISLNDLVEELKNTIHEWMKGEVHEHKTVEEVSAKKA